MIRPDIRLYLGRSGSGKSYLARHHAKAAPRVLIHDPNAEDGHAAGADVCIEQAALPAMLAAPRFRVCWRGGATMDAREAFEWANRCAFAAENLTVIWDEADIYLKGPRPAYWADRIVNSGRHRGISLYALARRAARIPRDLTALASRIIVFRTHEPIDTKYLREFIGGAADRLSHLDQYEAIEWTERQVRVRQSPFD